MKTINALVSALILVCWSAGCANHPGANHHLTELGRKQLEAELMQFAMANRDGSIVLIATPQTNGLYRVGSGFLVQGIYALYVVTAAHVATNANPGTIVVFRGTNDSSVQIRLTALQAIFQQNGVTLSVNEAADCAIIPFALGFVSRREILERIRYSTSSRLADLLMAPTNDLRGREMLLSGFANGMGTESGFKPPRVRARASTELSTITMYGKTARSFFLDVPGFQGMSGGPVTLAPEIEVVLKGNDMVNAKIGGKIMGLIIQTDGDESGGKFAKISHIQGVIELIDDWESGLARFVTQGSGSN
jgi:Trypsin-like peptidase domain